MSATRFLVPVVLILGIIRALRWAGFFEVKPINTPKAAPIPSSPAAPQFVPSPFPTVPILPSDAKKASTTKLPGIAFVSGDYGKQQVYIMNADGNNQVRLTNNPADDRFPQWLPR